MFGRRKQCVNKRSRQATEGIEDTLAKPTSGEGEEAKKEPRSTSFGEMIFREAEVIAKNLKESGTRR